MPRKKVTQTKTSASDQVLLDEGGKTHLINLVDLVKMEMDVWHGYQSGSLHDCQKNSLSDPFFVVTVPLRKLKSCGSKLMVIQKYKRLGSQICFYRMPMNNTDEEKMSEYLPWKSKQERMCISRL